jgi:tripartite-type tricarboxylate transporter receptor subunit TctC
MLLTVLSAPALSQSQSQSSEQTGYPNRSLRLIVPFAPGGPTDLLARLTAQKLTEQLGQPVLVDNRAGGGGTIGAEVAARAPADGYTLFYGSSATLAIAPALYARLGYDAQKSFAPVSLVARSPMVLTATPALPANTLRELITLAKAQPGRLHYGSAGSGSPLHLAGEMLKASAGIDLVHVPYKGAAPARADLMSGSIELMFESPASVAGAVRSGKVKALAITASRRDPALPEVPTAIEGGLAGFEVWSWNGLVAPAGTPPAILARLAADTRKAVQATEVRAALARDGTEAVGSTPEEFAAFINTELARWGRVVRLSGARVE